MESQVFIITFVPSCYSLLERVAIHIKNCMFSIELMLRSLPPPQCLDANNTMLGNTARPMQCEIFDMLDLHLDLARAEM